MKLARSWRRASLAALGLAAASGAPALAYDDKSTVSSVMELVGVSSDPSAGSIDYRERPKLVLPPRAGDLPAPKENASRPAEWPTDAATARRRNSDRYAKIPNAPAEERERKPGLLESALSAGSGTAAPVLDEPNRRMLSDPPSGYRRPTKNVSTIADPEAKKGSWWNPMTYIGGGGDGQSQSVAVSQPQQKQASGESQSWFRLPRFVLKDPDKE